MYFNYTVYYFLRTTELDLTTFNQKVLISLHSKLQILDLKITHEILCGDQILLKNIIAIATIKRLRNLIQRWGKLGL